MNEKNGFSPRKMHLYHSNREQIENSKNALEKRINTLGTLIKYLSLVPFGKADERERGLNPELRKKFFEERGCMCEACSKKIQYKDFELHHTNYFKGDNPEVLKIICKPCHQIINVLTGMIEWFELETVPRVDSDEKEYLSYRMRPIGRTEPIEQE